MTVGGSSTESRRDSHYSGENELTARFNEGPDQAKGDYDVDPGKDSDAMNIICLALQLYLYVIFARIILSWFPVSNGGVMASAQSALFSVTEPVLGPIRRALPPVRLGAMGLDLSPIIVVVGLTVLRGFIC